jgi:hypothetical protein
VETSAATNSASLTCSGRLRAVVSTRAPASEHGHYSRANAIRAAGRQRALALKFEIAAHERISNERIFPPASTK